MRREKKRERMGSKVIVREEWKKTMVGDLNESKILSKGTKTNMKEDEEE